MNDKTELVAKNGAEQTSPVRKPYAVPVLRTWGSLKDLTMSRGNSGSSDGGGGRGGRGANRTR
jgi:hypothetical protein